MNNRNLIGLCRTFIITFALILSSGSAFSINKCAVDGQVTYTDLPCPEQANSTPFTQQVIPPNDPAAAKKRYLSDQKQLQKITQQKIKDDKQHQREAAALARHIKKEEDKKFRCNELDVKRKSARQHQSDVQLRGNSKATEKARLNVKQAENRYVHYCKS